MMEVRPEADRHVPPRRVWRFGLAAVLCGAIGSGAYRLVRSPPGGDTTDASGRPAPSAPLTGELSWDGPPAISRFEPWAGEVAVGPGMNLAGRNLRRTRLAEADLSGSNFDGCDFLAARLNRCNLRNASFRGARLTGAMLESCPIEGADFTDAVIEDMVLGDDLPRFSPEQLMSTRSYRTRQLMNCPISGGNSKPARYDFQGADLRGAVILGDVRESDFTEADIRGVAFQGTIRFEQLTTTKSFRERKLSGVRLLGIVEGKQDYFRVRLEDCELAVRGEADFQEAEFAGRCRIAGRFDRADLEATLNYRRGNLAGITFVGLDLSGADLSGADLSGMNLTGAAFDSGCRMNGADLTDSVITRAVFRDEHGTLGLTLEQVKATWNYRHDRTAGVVLPASAQAPGKNLPAGKAG